MSLGLTRAVWKHSKVKYTDRMVLVALADFVHNKDVDTCFPSIETISKKCLLSIRSTQIVIGRLVEAGELRVITNTGRGQTNEYQILFSPLENTDSNPHKDRPERVQSDVERVQSDVEKGCNPLHPEQDLEREENDLKETRKKKPRKPRAQTASLIPIEPPESLKAFDAILRTCQGYQPTDAFYSFVIGRYGADRDLEADAIDMQDWLGKHPDRQCSAGFIRKWLSRSIERNSSDSASDVQTWDEWKAGDYHVEGFELDP